MFPSHVYIDVTFEIESLVTDSAKSKCDIDTMPSYNVYIEMIFYFETFVTIITIFFLQVSWNSLWKYEELTVASEPGNSRTVHKLGIKGHFKKN